MRTGVDLSEERGGELPIWSRWPIEVVRGDGVFVEDREGRRFLDLYGGHAVAALGYGHPRLAAALERQAKELIFQSNAVAVPVRERAIRKLVRFAPEGLHWVFLANSGAEANENALRVACKVTGRDKVVCVEGAFHGRTAAAAACTDGSAKWYGFPRTPLDVEFVPRDDVAALDAAIDTRTAAFLFEPVQGLAGAFALDDDFVRAARRLTKERGALLIADEVQCGVGRTGRNFAVEHAGVVPDLLTTAKALGAGFPVGALLLDDRTAAQVKPGDLGTTFGGGPLACAAMEAVLDTLEADHLVERAGRLGRLFAERCAVGPVTSVHGRGLLLGLRTRTPAAEVLSGLREHGILAGGAKDPHVVRLLPPFVLEDDHVELLRQALLAL